MNLIILVLLIITIFLFIKSNSKKEYNTSNIIILTNDQIKNFILNDNDGFLNSLTLPDLYARKVLSINQYKNIIIKDINYNLSDKELKLIYKAVNKADKLLYIKYRFLSELEWKLAIINNRNYEGGYPHTRKDIIFIFPWIFSLPFNTLVRIFIHEKFHVLQRNFPNHPIMKDYMKNFKKIKHKNDLLKEEPLLRSNPDLDEWIYKSKDGLIMYSVYNNNYPNSIVDSISDSKLEHPYEKMAYELSSQLI